MADGLSPSKWVRHLVDVDRFGEYLRAGGSAIRVVVTDDTRTHKELTTAIEQMASEGGFLPVRVDATSCDKLHQPQAVLAAIIGRVNLFDGFTRIASMVWNELGYPCTEVTTAKVAERHGLSARDVRSEFPAAARGILRESRLGRDHQRAVLRVLLDRIDNDHLGRAGAERFESYFRGTIGMRDVFDLGLQRKVTKQNAGPALRNLVAFARAAGHRGTVLHLDLRWASDGDLLGDSFKFRATKTQRVAVYQWVRELIDSIERFDSAFVCVEFGPSFPDSYFMGRGWGLYDALRLRLEDGVRPADGQNPSAPFVHLER